jgi:redox-sensitive bicupin YhaK (pirin superfamily)
MSNLETRPAELTCSGVASPHGVEILEPREVPLGGPRAMRVRRTLPQRRRSLIGAWCFVDHYGPDAVAQSGGMNVPPHPHTGLQTVSWLFTGAVEHRDSAGHHAIVRPGELNLMTAGRGISHSEVSTPETTVLHGAQLWLALPAHARFADPTFERYAPPEQAIDGLSARVFLGAMAHGATASPVRLHVPLVGAELAAAPGTYDIALDPSFEHGVLVDHGSISVGHTPVAAGQLAYVAPGEDRIELVVEGDQPARILLLGGVPLGESIVMWWNFVGRSHDEIVAFRTAWQGEIGASARLDPVGPDGARFGLPVDDPAAPLAAPELPNVRIRPRS